MKAPQTKINTTWIKRVPDRDGEFVATSTSERKTELFVVARPGVPTDPAEFLSWVKAENKRLNPRGDK